MRTALASILMTELKDPRLQQGLVTITQVETTRDLQSAVVWVSVLGTDEETESVIEALNHSRGFIKHLLRERVVLKYLPDLQFRLDKSGRYAAHINQLLKQVEPDLKSGGAEEGESVLPSEDEEDESDQD